MEVYMKVVSRSQMSTTLPTEYVDNLRSISKDMNISMSDLISYSLEKTYGFQKQNSREIIAEMVVQR